MAALWGSRGRPETNQWAALGVERQISRNRGALESLRVVATYVPESPVSPRLVESPRKSQKWSAARARHPNPDAE